MENACLATVEISGGTTNDGFVHECGKKPQPPLPSKPDTVVVTVKKYEAWIAFTLNASKMEPKVHFLLLRVLMYGAVLEAKKDERSGPFYWRLIYSRSNVDIFLQLQPL